MAGVHLSVLVTTALSTAWLVSASACRYRQLRPPILQTCAGTTAQALRETLLGPGCQHLLCCLGLLSVGQLCPQSNLTRTAGWAMAWAGWDLQLQGGPKKGQPPLPSKETRLERQGVVSGETLPYPALGQSLN